MTKLLHSNGREQLRGLCSCGLSAAFAMTFDFIMLFELLKSGPCLHESCFTPCLSLWTEFRNGTVEYVDLCKEAWQFT